ncbi:hypothetical protein SAMN04488503_0752 [Humidesulfovibrio mexicanus]|uniref:Alpha/beta hydrolase family protein n=1 Tax=Humidesulfovibrio mexicanus TaxID=147047 RepID=A0A238Y9H3_9BACT|nr:hypothetical protein [Humidesulfovibrio mexicanus]SNR66989.1 hypothetical protein SAMN04488503_0752 [Humidesulfovibrio mexicanus]
MTGAPWRALSALAAILCLGLLVGACSSRHQQADELARSGKFQPRRFDTTNFVLMGWERQGQGDTLCVYIEGDGLAWRRRNRPSMDPTPSNPVGLRLAMADATTAPVLYLGRPCQYTQDADRRGCSVELWTSDRFSERAVEALDAAVTQAKRRHGATSIALHGYSGGGAMAALLAERRQDVTFLATVAGNLDPDLWTRLHGDSPLTGSLNPVDKAQATRNIPQLHVIGGMDTVIQPVILDSWSERTHGARITRIRVQEAGHEGPWEALWPGFVKKARGF